LTLTVADFHLHVVLHFSEGVIVLVEDGVAYG
jgi:hypothetical protein